MGPDQPIQMQPEQPTQQLEEWQATAARNRRWANAYHALSVISFVGVMSLFVGIGVKTLSGSQAATTSVPGVPTSVTTAASAKSIAIMWGAPASSKVITKYNVYRNSKLIGTAIPNTAATVRAYTPGTRYIDTTITAGTNYSYQIEAVDSAGGKSAKSSAVSVSASTSSVAEPTIKLDSSLDPSRATWLANVVKPELLIWYPKIANRMASPDYAPPSSFTVKVNPSYTGIAQLDAGNVITISNTYFKNNPKDMGVLIHELAHVIQVYPYQPARPSWVTEGLADWIRAYYYRDTDFTVSVDAKVNYYDQSYRVTAYFFEWIRKNSISGIIRSLNVASHAGTPTASFEKTGLGGKSFDQLWGKMLGITSRGGAITLASNSNVCIDDSSGLTTDGNKIQVWGCNGSGAQRWGITTTSDGVSLLHVVGSCLYKGPGGATAENLPTQLWSCWALPQEQWKINSNKTISNVLSGKCLTAPSTTPGTRLVTATCKGASNQLWNVPK